LLHFGFELLHFGADCSKIVADAPSFPNALQRAAYFSIPVAGFFSVATGWALHKPMQFHWLAALFGGFDTARVWHFWLMWLFILFVVPHVILVLADGWDALRSMIVGWSTRVKRPEFTAK
jgi:thiosulfate reductase cytochrome b subunit